MASKLIVTNLSHDLQARKSYIHLVWSDDASRRLGLEVPFDTSLADAEKAARQALGDLSRELDASELELPSAPA